MTVERLAPDSVLASTNLSGATVANLDEDPDSADLDWATASGNNVATDVRTSFGTPSGPLTAGAGLQEFRAAVRKSTLSGTGTPTARIELWENGSLVSTGGENNVTSLVGQVISYTWNASGRTASLIEAKVVGTQSGGSPAVRASVDVGAVEWNADYTVSFTGTSAQTLPTLSGSSAGTHTPPTFTGAAALTLASLVAVIGGTVVNPGSTGSAAQTLPTVTQAAAGEVEAPIFSGSVAGILPALTQAAVGSHDPPVYTATAAQTLAPLTQAATGSTGSTVTGAASQTLPQVTQSAVGDAAPPVFTGAAALTLGALTQSGAGTTTGPVFTGSSAQTLPAVTQAVEGIVTDGSGSAATITQILAAFTQSARGRITIVGHAPVVVVGGVVSSTVVGEREPVTVVGAD